MKMKFLAAAIACLSSSAFAGTNGDNVIDIAGASAPQQNVAKAVKALCTAANGSLTVFKGGASTSTYDNRMAYVCDVGMGGTDITVVRHSVNGGSLNSVLAMLNDTTVQFVNLASSSCAATAVAGSGDLAGFSVRAGCGNQGAVADGGFSDVEWKLSPELFTAAGDAFMANVSIDPVYVGQAFGIAVSKQLYEALQAAQKLTVATGGSCAVGDYTPACQPSISSAEMTALISNNLFSPLKQGVGGLLGTAAVDPLVYCRRPVTSGTQTATEAEFLGKQCRAADPSGALPVIAGPTLTGSTVSASTSYNGGKFVVTTNSGTGDARTCLNGAAAGYKFGVLSAENEPLATSQTWRFVKLDGVSVTDGTASSSNRKSAVAIDKADGPSNYKFAYEMVLHTNVADGVTGDEELTLLNAIVDELKVPASVSGNGLLNRGLYQIPDGGTDHATAPDEVSLFQRGGSAPNNCVPLSR